jgi:hypothetical protein
MGLFDSQLSRKELLVHEFQTHIEWESSMRLGKPVTAQKSKSPRYQHKQTMMANKTILAVIIACWRLLLLASFAAAASAADIATTAGGEPTMTLHGRLQYPDQTPYNITTKISVNHGQYTTYSRTDGHFTLYDLSPGIYLIDALSVHHHFSQVKCQYKPSSSDAVPEQDTEVEDNGKTTTKPTLSCIEYLYPGAPKRVVDYSSSSQSEQPSVVVKIHALAAIKYF